MEKYESYKSSGIEWIGEIPEKWRLNYLKQTCDILNGYAFKSGDYEDVGLPIVRIGDVRVNFNLKDCKRIPDSKLSTLSDYIIKQGDILIAMTGATIGKNCTFQSNEICYLNQRVGAIRVKKDLEQVYLGYLIQWDRFLEYVKLECAGGAQENIGKDELSNFPFPLPSLKEQTQIVSYLDRKTALIDSLIDKTERKIELLKEKRIALINQAVTKGLDPNVPMKDSGVEWIGEIPEHWEVGKLYQYATLQSGATPSRSKNEYWEEGTIPWMSSGEVNKKIINSIDGRITELGHQNSNTPILPVGTVMIALNGQGKTKGTVALLKTETTCNQSLCGIILKTAIESEFAFHYLESQYFNLRGMVGEGKREGLSVSFLSTFPLLVAPKNEQVQIINKIDFECRKIDKLLKFSVRQLMLLKEYRQA